MESRRSSASYAEPPAAAICAGEIQNGLVQQQDQYRLETNRKLSKRRNRLSDDVNTVQQSHRFGGCFISASNSLVRRLEGKY